jgi:hypothetical protein
VRQIDSVPAFEHSATQNMLTGSKALVCGQQEINQHVVLDSEDSLPLVSLVPELVVTTVHPLPPSCTTHCRCQGQRCSQHLDKATLYLIAIYISKNPTKQTPRLHAVIIRLIRRIAFQSEIRLRHAFALQCTFGWKLRREGQGTP